MTESHKSSGESLPGLEGLRRLGRNLKGYLGETIDITTVLADSLAAAREHGWTIEQIPVQPGLALPALTRGSGTRPRVYISAGIHGDEPAGPLAIRTLLQENLWPKRLDLWVCPCLNPAGFVLNRRENPQGVDLNRQYRQPSVGETIAHIGWLDRQPPFDLAICAHEDWESNGFYVYELNPGNRVSLAEAIIQRVANVCPIDRSEVIEGRPASGGVIRPSLDPRIRPDWPEAFYLITHKTPLSYTLEAPSDYPLSTRVAALIEGITAALENVKPARAYAGPSKSSPNPSASSP